MNHTSSAPDANLTPDPEAAAVLRRGRRRPGRWVLAGGAVIGIALVSIWAFSSGSGGDARYELAQATRGDLVLRVTAVGQLEAVDSVDVGSDLSGKIAEVAVRANDRVQTGQVLARLDSTPFDNAVKRARASRAQTWASLAQARVELRSAELDLARTQQLRAGGAATAVELETSQLQVDGRRAGVAGAVAQVSQAQAVLEDAEENLRKAVITSPIDGVVVQRLVDPGQTVVSSMQATSLFEVASDLTEMKAEVAVDEADVARVAAGQDATFTVSSWPDRRFEARVLSVDLAPDPNASVVTYDAELRLGNDDLALRPGMTATADIEVGRLQGVTLVPASALRFMPEGADEPEGDAVWTLVDGTPVAVPVKVLGSDGDHTAVQGTLEAGATVVLAEVR